MPTVVIPAGPKTACFLCDGPGNPKLRQCSKCRLARYCSTACQRSDWNDHKPFCLDHTEIKRILDSTPDSKEARRITNWLNYWRDGILRWATFCADLGHQSEDYLLDHRRPIKAGMCTDTEILQCLNGLPENSERHNVIKQFHRFPPQKNAMRYVVISGSSYHTAGNKLARLFPNDQHTLFSRKDSAEARSLSTQLKLAYLDCFADAVDQGEGEQLPSKAGQYNLTFNYTSTLLPAYSQGSYDEPN
ncbi:hypothetical protein DFH06DRAFT_1127886 [Mycena polygramma]|nr:hypothetical protein DFH06DRAFT_1127886 [Mycena polygramma]